MIKVMFFDYGIRGIRIFARIAEALAKENASSILVHISSWYGNYEKKEENLDGLTCRDISYYNGSLTQAIRAEKPDVIIDLNYTHTLDRALRRYCKSNNIKSVYLQHGQRPITAESLRNNIKVTTASVGLKGMLKRVPLYRKIMAFYFKANNCNPFKFVSFENLKYYYNMVTNPGKALLFSNPHSDLWWDNALVYGENYRKFLLEVNGYPSENIIIVGNLELDSSIQLWGNAKCKEICVAYLKELFNIDYSGNKYVLWLDSAFVESGFIGENVREGEIKNISKIAELSGYKVIIKLHPATNEKVIREYCASMDNVHVIKNADLGKLFWLSEIVISHGSTSLYFPLILGKPIFEFSDDSSKFTNSYAFANVLPKFSSENDILRVFEKPVEMYNNYINQTQLEVFVNNEIGPHDGNVAGRIAKQILQNVRNSK